VWLVAGAGAITLRDGVAGGGGGGDHDGNGVESPMPHLQRRRL